MRLLALLLALLPGLVSAQVLTRVVATDADTGTFVDGVTLQLQPVDASQPVVEAVTTSANGSAGTATFQDIAPGTYYAFAAPGSGYATTAPLRVEAGQFAAALQLIRFDRSDGRLEGSATDVETGSSLRFGRLAFVRDAPTGDSLLFVATDREGRYAAPVASGAFVGEAILRDPGPDGESVGYDPIPVRTTVSGNGATPLNLAFTPVRQGAIAGRVTDEAGGPLAGIRVSAFGPDGTATIVTTGADGLYSLTVRIGTYVVGAEGSTFTAEFYDDVTSRSAATPLAVGDGDALTDIDFALARAPEAFSVTVEGSVVNTNGDPARGVYATLFSDAGAVIAQDSSRADGTYRLVTSNPRAVDSAVRVCFRSPLYVFECYDNAATLAEATPLATGTEAITFTGIDAEVVGLAQGTVEGRVTDEATGEGLSGVPIRAVPVNGGNTTLTVTGTGGDYRFDALVGEYVLNTLPFAPYVSEFYDDAQALADATPIAVTDGSTASGVDFALARVADDFAVTLEGIVTDASGAPVRGATVTILDPEQFVAGTIATTGASGEYRFTSQDTRLAGARLAVFAADSSGSDARFQFYNGQPSLELADRLEIGTDAVSFTGIDFTLATPEDDLRGFAISGSVQSEVTGGPLGGATVLAVRTDAPGFRAVTSSASGAYRLDGLAAGTYTVLFVAGDHVPEFYPDASSWEEGSEIQLTGDLNGVNALIGGLNRPVGTRRLTGAPFIDSASLMGAVRGDNGPLRGALVVGRDASGAATAFALTDGSGQFEIDALPAETATLQVDLASYGVERRILSPGALVQFVTLTPRISTAGEEAPDASGTDLSVFPNPTRGRATVAFSLAESADVRVALYDVLGREVAVVADGPLASGAHAATVETAGMAPGLYVVRVESASGASTARFTVVR